MRNSQAALVFDNQTESKGSIIRKPGSKKLYVLFYYLGRRVERTTGLDDTPANRHKVRIWLDRQFLKIGEGTFCFAEAFPGASEDEKKWFTVREGREYSPDPRSVLFGVYLDHWMKRVWEKYRSENKKNDYLRIIKTWIRPYFKDISFAQLNSVEMQVFLGQLNRRKGKRQGEPLSTSRIRNIFIVLRAIWNDACEEYNFELRDPFRFIHRHLPKKRKKQPQVLRFDEWLQIYENLEPYYQPIAEFMMLTGMIASEVAGLRIEDITEDKILVRNSLRDGIEKDTLKTVYREREFPITARLRQILDRAMEHSEDGHLFRMKSGLHFDACNFRKRAWTPAITQAGLQYRVPYVTRHTFAAWSLVCDIHPNRLVKLMGHGTKQMVYEVYGQYVEGVEKDRERIRDFFGADFF